MEVREKSFLITPQLEGWYGTSMRWLQMATKVPSVALITEPLVYLTEYNTLGHLVSPA